MHTNKNCIYYVVFGQVNHDFKEICKLETIEMKANLNFNNKKKHATANTVFTCGTRNCYSFFCICLILLQTVSMNFKFSFYKKKKKKNELKLIVKIYVPLQFNVNELLFYIKVVVAHLRRVEMWNLLCFLLVNNILYANLGQY